MIKFAREKTGKDVENIISTFTGEDGGGKFIKFLAFVNEFDKRAESGDEAAKKIIDVVEKFSRLIDIAEKIP